MGWLWLNNEKLHFSYTFKWLTGPFAVPIDPIYLPLDKKIYSAPGLTGPLRCFGFFIAGSSADTTAFRWLANLISSLPVYGSANVSPPQDPLCRLAWCSEMGFPVQASGLYFDAAATFDRSTQAGPIGCGVPYVPDLTGLGQAAEFYVALRRAVMKEPPNKRFNLALLGRVSKGFYDAALCRNVLPLPGESIRATVDQGGMKGTLRICQPAGSVNANRCRYAYMRLAERCGLRVAASQLFSLNGSDYYWQEVIRWRDIGLGRLSPDGRLLFNYEPIRQERGFIATLPAASPQEGILRARKGMDNMWIRDGGGKSVQGLPPVSALIGYARDIERRGDLFDREEALRRITFALMCGTMIADDTPIQLIGRRNGWHGHFGREPITWMLAPLVSIKPTLLPIKSASAINKTAAENASRCGKLLGVTESQVVRILDEVVRGCQEWHSIAKESGLNEYEEDGFRPAVAVHTWTGHEGRSKNRPGRPTSISADFQ